MVEIEAECWSPGEITPLVLLLGSALSSCTTGEAIAVDGGALRAVAY